MSCLSRLFGLIVALVPGLGSLFLALALVGRWGELGLPKGALYSLLCAVTGAVCLFLGGAILFGRGRAHTEAASGAPAVSASGAPTTVVLDKSAPVPNAAQQSIFADAQTAPPSAMAQGAAPAENAPASALDSPASRIAQLGRSRPGWRGNAPQLAQLCNLSLGVAEATARSMAGNGEGVMLLTGENGEAIFVLTPGLDN